MDALVTIHSWVRWLVLLGLVAGVGLGISRHLNREEWSAGYFSATVIAFDIQVLVGIVLYVGNEGWNQGTFIAVIHPVFMILALLAAHAGMGWARRQADGGEPNKVIGYAFFVSLVLVIAAVPWDRLTS